MFKNIIVASLMLGSLSLSAAEKVEILPMQKKVSCLASTDFFKDKISSDQYLKFTNICREQYVLELLIQDLKDKSNNLDNDYKTILYYVDKSYKKEGYVKSVYKLTFLYV